MNDPVTEETPERPVEESWDVISRLISTRDAGLGPYIDTLTPAEVARAISRLGREDQTALLTLLDSEEAADILEEVPEAQAGDLIEELPAGRAAAIVEEMHSDERADLLGSIDHDDAEAILTSSIPSPNGRPALSRARSVAALFATGELDRF